MNNNQWKIFCNFKKDFKEKVTFWKSQAPELAELQKAAVEKAGAPLYSFETSVVYNKALDDVKETDNIKLIVIGDNPGKDEQFAKNNRYLVGQAGKIAEGYFKRNPELGIDFRKDVIILNKTPIHSGKTAQLKTIIKLGGEKIANLINESQVWMAKRTARLHIELCNSKSEECDEFMPELWLVGYSELKDKGIFKEYRNYLKQSYFDTECNKALWNKVFVFQHFSMNRFSIDLNNYINDLENNIVKDKTLKYYIHVLGTKHRKEIFGN